jgi:cytoskeletal protein CcmA (bactofilin family)
MRPAGEWFRIVLSRQQDSPGSAAREGPETKHRRNQRSEVPQTTGKSPKEIALMDVPKSGEFAHIGKSVVIKGELSGSEDLYLDGQVEGSILLKGNNLTVGPNGQVKANVNAKSVIVQGKLEGNLQASDRVELRKSAIVLGDIATQRIAIEEGAYLKGKVDISKDGAK